MLAATRTASSSARPASASSAVQDGQRAARQAEREHVDERAHRVLAQRGRARPRMPKVRRRLACVLATAVIASASALAPPGAERPAQQQEEQRVGDRRARRRPPGSAISRAAASRRAMPRRSSSAVRTMSTRESGSSTQSTGTSWMRSPSRWASTSSSVSKNQPSSRTAGSSRRAASARTALKPHCASEKRAPSVSVQQPVVGARDELALGRRARRASRGARRVPIATSLWPESSGATQRQQRAQVGRQVDVHVADDVGVAALPGRAQRAAAALLGQRQQLDAGQVLGQRRGDARRLVRARVVGDDDPPARSGSASVR